MSKNQSDYIEYMSVRTAHDISYNRYGIRYIIYDMVREDSMILTFHRKPPASDQELYDIERVNGGASSRWSFGPHSAWGSIESTTILTTQPSLFSSEAVHFMCAKLSPPRHVI